MIIRFVFVALLLVSLPAFGWSATSLGGGKWAITCANGTSSLYSGSSAGLDVVGPALCPGGLRVPVRPDAGATLGIPNSVDYDLVRNLKEMGLHRIRWVA